MKIQEVFKGFTNIKLFSGFDHVVAEAGYYALRPMQISMRDTIMHPNAWENAKALFGYVRFDEKATLIFAFGKPFSSDAADTARLTLSFTRSALSVVLDGKKTEYACSLAEKDSISFSTEQGFLSVSIASCGQTVRLCDIAASDLCGYMGISCLDGEVWMSAFEAEFDGEPLAEAEHARLLKAWRAKKLDEVDVLLDRFEEYVKANPTLLYQKHADLFLPTRLLDAGEEMTVTIRTYGEPNAAFSVTHDSLKKGAKTVSYPLSFEKVEEGVFECNIPIRFDTAGNTRIDLWANGDKLVRNVAVLKKGYMAVIPWMGAYSPFPDEELHRYGIAGDYWIYGVRLDDPAKTLENVRSFVRCAHRYGDRAAKVYNSARDIVPKDEGCNVFELDHEEKVRGFRQYDRLRKIVGMPEVEIAASYTADGDTLVAMEECGIKAMTSLCLWQNWQDGGWLINHWGAANQPYHPAPDDYRRNGERRDIMCFTMGNSSDIRNYSIMAMDSCPTLVVPGERYFDKRVEHFQVQRFFDAFDQYLEDAKGADELMTVTLCIEAFRGSSDWNAANEIALRYVVECAQDNNIVFTSAADVADYHKRKGLAMQKAYFCQPDFYYGYHNGELPGRAPDRIEADTPEYLAVIHKGNMLPAFFYDYTEPWEDMAFDDSGRNIFGLVNPDTNDTTRYSPPQSDRKGVTVSYEYEGNKLVLHVASEKAMRRMVTGVFDIPFAKGFSASADKTDVALKTVCDRFTENTHLFIDLGAIAAGEETIVITLSGTPRAPVNVEVKKELFAAMWFGDHAYMRSLDMQKGIAVSIPAPSTAYLIRQDGVRIEPKDGTLDFTVNMGWYDEAPILYGYEQKAFENALAAAKIEVSGTSESRRWSW